LKLSRELKTGLIAVGAIAVLVTGVNFLKGNSFFGGDDVYSAFFPNSGQLAPASQVTLNGVGVGKVLSVEYNPKGTDSTMVKVTFNIQNKQVKIPVGSVMEIGSLDFFSKGLLIRVDPDLSKGFHKVGDVIPGTVEADLVSDVKSTVDPIATKLQSMMVSVDKLVNSVSVIIDDDVSSGLENSLNELKVAIKRFGNVAYETEGLIMSEKAKISRVLTNIESISDNLKASNEQVTKIIGNMGQLTDDLVTSEYKEVISGAKETLIQVNKLLAKANNDGSTLGKLLSDDKLYNELNETNQAVQNLVKDLQLHPERYIHFSVLGAKTKGAPLNSSEEKKLRKLLDSIPD
jgi:phospholipid/cholesterol/gamma-HCH transport system substrate-binding protein